MNNHISFQNTILKLQEFWMKQGCLITQSTKSEVGAGTLNKNTALKVLGNKPWKTAYVELCHRPADGRYGKSPNRLQQFHQFQVILKPVPKDIQKIYIESLEYIGLNSKEYDLRFIEDNWEHPGLGASGIGWEVWSKGMEITQYTYFQQCGGIPLETISCEITYGLERIVMHLQKVKTFYDIIWGDMKEYGKVTYGDLYKQEEYEWSCYNFEKADISLLFNSFNICVKEIKRLLNLNLVYPAYDFLLKCNHLFNLLDSRGAIGTIEKKKYIEKIRELSNLCAKNYLKLN